MALSREERERFLAEPHIAALSVDSGDAGRAPLSVPVWYGYEPAGDAWIVTEGNSRKAQLIAGAGRFTLLVDRTEPTLRYVSVEGPVTETRPATKELAHELAARYLPEPKATDFVEWSWEHLTDQVVIRLRPERWLSADFGQG